MKEDPEARGRLGRLERFAAAPAAPPASPPVIEGPLGLELVLVRGGTFVMGSDSGRPDELPVRRVRVSPFYMSRCEVTVLQFESFRKCSPALLQRTGPAWREPAVSVPWQDASAFCRFVQGLDPSGAAYRLPAEAEWELAARGTEGRTFPWGEDRSVASRANLRGGADGYVALAPVGSFPEGATPEGIVDLLGNAAEWCLDWYGPYPAGDAVNPRGPAIGARRVVRGGSFAVSPADWPAASVRGVPSREGAIDTIGFRVVRELAPAERSGER
jgi:formylglycine-generating enzyme required for sulfatase activity